MDDQAGPSSALAHAIDYAVDQGAKVISMSIGFPGMGPNPANFPAVSAAIERAVDAGVILVAATGNPSGNDPDGEPLMNFPASHPLVISVSGIDKNEEGFGDYGTPPGAQEPYLLDFVAPAKNIRSLIPKGNMSDYEVADDLGTGTSQANAITAGVVALMVSTDVCIDQGDVVALLKDNAERINGLGVPGETIYDVYTESPDRSQRFGFGLINPLPVITDIRANVLASPNSSTTINNSKNVPQDLIISSGTTLTIGLNGVLNVAPDRKIIVERGARLIIDGGKITSCTGDKWRGIYVLGSSTRPQPSDPDAPLAAEDSGILWVKNGGTIENAHNAVYTKHPEQFWLSEYWGALIVAENAFFKNNRRAVEFMQYTAHNNSRFTNTEFHFTDNEDNLAAVTIWDTDNILFEDCDFLGYETAVIAWDAGCELINSNFENCDYGLEIFATSPVSSGAPISVTGNVFQNIRLDAISSQASGIPKLLRIRENNFMDTDFAIYLNGKNDFQILNNRIERAFVGINPTQTGQGLSEINCNSMEQLSFSVAAVGDCSGISILDNGFEASYSDISVWETSNQESGKLAPGQGAEEMPANNCFSPGITAHLEVYGSTEPFTYYVPNDVPLTDCRIPASAGGNNISETTTELLIECNRPFQGPGDDKDAYLDLLNQYLDRLSGGIGTIQQEQVSTLSTYELRRQLRAGLQQWLSNGLANGVSSDLEDIIVATDPEEGTKQLYGLHLQRGEWTLAQQYLSDLRMEAKNNDFVAIQEINLARLQSNTGSFEPTIQQWGIMESVALMDKAAANHAKALLSLLRGDHFPAQLPLNLQAFQAAPLAPTSNVSIRPKLYPIPASNTLQLTHLPFTEEIGKVRIIDQLGRILMEEPFRQTRQMQLDVNNLAKGLYFIEIIDGKDSSTVLRVIIDR